MASLLPLFFDTVNKKLVKSETNPGEFKLPTLHQEEQLTIKLVVLKRISEAGFPFFERVSITGFDLQISVGTAGTVNASQSSWTASDNDTALEGVLDLNTSEIGALADNTAQILEIRLFDATNYYRGQFACIIKKAVATIGSPQPIAQDIALGQKAGDRRYVKKEMAAGESIIWTDANGVKYIEYMHTDGSKRVEPIS